MDHVQSRGRLDFVDVVASVGAVPEPVGFDSAGRADHGGCSESIVRETRGLGVEHRRDHLEVGCSFEMKVRRKLDGSMRRHDVVDSAVDSDACSPW